MSTSKFIKSGYDHNCRWVLADNTYCEKPVKYRMVEDGGEPGAELVRKYDNFCPEHMKKFASQREDEGEELV